MSTYIFRLGALMGVLGVCLGAFGSHALKPILETNGTLETYKTGVLYHLIHTSLIIVIANSRYHTKKAVRAIGYLSIAGIILFSGSLYLMSILSWKWLGPITPLGGLLFIAAWITSAVYTKKQEIN